MTNEEVDQIVGAPLSAVAELAFMYRMAAVRLREKEERILFLKAQIDETFTDENGTVWTRPTAWAYAQVCKALERAKAQCGQSN